MNTKTLITAAALAIVLTAPAAHAGERTVTCTGKLITYEDADAVGNCLLRGDGYTGVKDLYSICHPGQPCIVRARISADPDHGVVHVYSVRKGRAEAVKMPTDVARWYDLHFKCSYSVVPNDEEREQFCAADEELAKKLAALGYCIYGHGDVGVFSKDKKHCFERNWQKTREVE